MSLVDVPGGDVVLGIDEPVRSLLARVAPPRSFARFDADGVIAHLESSPVDAGAFFSRRRTVRIAPMRVERDAVPFGDFVSSGDDVEDVLTRACEDGKWRLPTLDEWEYLYGAGALTPFPWGDEWRSWSKSFTNAFGLRFACKTECTAQRRLLGGGDPDGWNLNGYDGNIVYLTSYFMYESHVAHFEWEAYEASALRRILVE